MLLVCGLLVLSAGAVSTSTADASQPPHPVYTLQGGIPSDGPTTSDPRQLAINDANHTLLVADLGNSRVSVFSPTIDPLTGTLTPEPSVGVGALVSPYGLAVDQALHRLYVSDVGTNTIVRYTFTTGDPATFTVDPTFTSPSLGAGAGQVGNFAAPLAVDPTTHDLLVADSGNHRVSRYSATGAFVRSLNGSTGADGVFVAPSGVGVGPDGTIYVADSAGANDSLGHLERFSATGASLGDLPGLDVPLAVGVGGTLGTVVVGSSESPAFNPSMFSFLDGSAVQTIAQFDQNGTADTPVGIAVDDSLGGNLYFDFVGLFSGGASTGIFVMAPDPVLAPGVSIGASSAVTLTSAHIDGVIDSGDATATASTSAHFEYYTTDPASPTLLPDLTLPGAGPNTVVANLSGLRPNTTYHVQLKAQRNDDSLTDPVTGLTLARTASSVLSVTTPAAPPAVTEPEARDVGSTSATLPGTVDPFGQQTSYHFEYGLTDGYGRRSPAALEAVLGAQQAPQSVRANLTDLAPDTVYHYRLVATNASGTTFGPDRQLTTDPPTPPEVRGYEQVTPVDKGGALMSTGVGFVLHVNDAPSDGTAVYFGTQGSLPGTDIATGLNTEYLGTRVAGGWSDRLVEVPLTTFPNQAVRASSVVTALALSQHPFDAEHSVVYSNRALAPGAVPGLTNFYREDNATGALTLLGSLPFSALDTLSTGLLAVYATPDTEHVFIDDNDEYYEASGGQLTLLSKTTTGNPLGTANIPLSYDGRGLATISMIGPISTPDGHTVVYSSSTEGAFLNHDGAVTPISVSERPGDPSTPAPVDSAMFSEDGSSVFFLEGTPPSGTPPPLTADGNTQPGGPIYRYTLDPPPGQPHLTYIGGQGATSTGGAQFAVFKPSANGQTVVFTTPDGLMAWRHGQREILSATYGATMDLGGGYPSPSLSDSGRFLSIKKAEALTSDPDVNDDACGGPGRDGRCAEVYLFDLDAGTVVCASCAADGSLPGGDAALGQDAAQTVTDDGEVFFDTPTRLVSADANANSDVYAYRSGRVRLVSRGTPDTNAVLQGASLNGRDVFMLTDDRLVAQDTDNAVDLYDARIGGGFPAQAVGPDETAPCAATECHEPGGGAGSTSGPSVPSERVLTATNAPPGPVRVRVTTTRVAVGATAVRLRVHASGRGGLRISGRYLTTLKRSVAAPGTYTIRVALTRAAQRLHRGHHRLQVGVRVSLTPPLGVAAVATLTRTLRG